MVRSARHIPWDEVPAETRRFLRAVLEAGDPVTIEIDGDHVARFAPDAGTPRPSGPTRRPPRRVVRDQIEAALALAGAWRDLDANAMLDELERLDREVPPTPIIDEP